MKIGIDARTLSTSRAISRYTKNIIEWLLRLDRENDYFLFVENERLLRLVPVIAQQLPGLRYQPVIVSKKILLRDHFFLRDTMDNIGLDLFFHPDNSELLFCHPNSIVTIHDCTPWKYPELVYSRSPLMRFRQQIYTRLQTIALRRSSRHLIAVSENTKRDLISVLNFDPEDISVIYEGIESLFRPIPEVSDIEKVKRKYKITGEYIFYLGGFEEHKNVERLFKAFGEVGAHNLKLVLGGQPDERSGYLTDLASDLGMSERIAFTGFIEEADLPYLYSGAVLSVYPSLSEGFGFPPLESMACGTPVVLSDRASLPEIGGQAAVYINPESVDSLAAGISQVLNLYTDKPEGYKVLADQCRRQAGLFSWEKCARETLAVFNKVAGGKK